MIRAHISYNAKGAYYFRDTYFCTVDLDQKKTHKFIGDNGKEFVLFIASESIQDHKYAHPNTGEIAFATEGAQFPVGTSILTTHFAFQDETFKSKGIFKESDVEYFKAVNLDIIAGIVDGELVPREGNLLCKPVLGKLVDTTVETTGKYEGKRRDIALVQKIWEGCTDYKVGDYVLLNKGGDYYFNHAGEEWMKVDTYFDDVFAIVDSPEWRIDEERLHAVHGEKI